MYEHIRSELARAVTETKSPGAVLYVGDRSTTFLHEAFGLRERGTQKKSAKKDTLYDLASLTKVVATTTAVMILRNEKLLRLDQPITDFVPVPGYADITIFHLLTHTAGLTPDNPFYATVTSLDELIFRYAEKGIVGPPGIEQQYSDIGYMLLGRMVEIVARDSLDSFCKKHIFEPLGMARTTFNPPPDWIANCAATEKSAWRGRTMLGEVHDENAYAVGGVAGHAGLFSTAEDLARFSRGLLDAKILRESTLHEMTKIGTLPYYPWQGLGWEIDPWSSKKKGFMYSRAAFGHTGWTGTSLWIDRNTGLIVVLLGNTCHPSRKYMDNETFRRIVHMAVTKQFFPQSATSHTGLDRLVRENFASVSKASGRNRHKQSDPPSRIGLLTNHAAVDQLHRSIADVFDLTDRAEIRMLFTPEHGLSAQVERGMRVEGEQAPVPLVSLYRQDDKQLRDSLDSIDFFVVDLQDVGSRYYTYNHTMRRCIAACAEAKKPVVVLDRPNPVGGAVLEGPIAQDTSHAVSCAAIPIRHAMTIGELALHYATTELHKSELQLSISRLDNWPRERLFSECNLPWVPPSPNIPTPETALLYVGMCLFEGTNLNEGRGTESPFTMIGAPWLDPHSVIENIHDQGLGAFDLSALTYTPRSIPGKASKPTYENEECPGIRIEIRNPHTFRPFALAIELIRAIRHRHPAKFTWREGNTFDILAGGPDLRTRIEDGQPTASIVKDYARQLNEFDANRPRLYRDDGVPFDTGN